MRNLTLEDIRSAIAEKEAHIQRLGEDLNRLRSLRVELEANRDEAHFDDPRPGDFWHEMFSPVLIVLAADEDGVTVCEKTKAVYETPDQAMVLKSYESPEDPEVKEYFARPRKDIGYTFDLEAARRVSRSEFKGMLKCYGESMKDSLTYRCIPGRAEEFVSIWKAMGKNLSAQD